ncbi:hypothetical protein NDU88_003721 [Pleurodeles waltl]|uniref:Syntaxin N-terminal domain-containing protein n=1 Tax=Pleurodeles waltl TaxID=8319 RepID=A0AAV7TPV2_PLEWA|nr:hypothetical protein NDU88_003721 [Pleurodeles waltl]
MDQGGTPDKEQTNGEVIPPSTLDIKNFILERNKAITKKIGGVAITVALLHQDMEKMKEHMKDLGTSADGVEEILGAHTSQLADQEIRLKLQEAKLAYIEDRSRCNNVRILGLQRTLSPHQ